MGVRLGEVGLNVQFSAVAPGVRPRTATVSVPALFLLGLGVDFLKDICSLEGGALK